MRFCTFFGHSVCPSEIYDKLREQIIILIDRGISEFFVGDRGEFDVMVLKALRELKEEYTFNYQVVLAYLPKESGFFSDDPNSVFPEELACVYKRFAIDYRNNYMLKRSDYVITYTPYPFGGAAKFAEKARRQGKTVIEL